MLDKHGVGYDSLSWKERDQNYIFCFTILNVKQYSFRMLKYQKKISICFVFVYIV